jgi:hypothetical protein
VFVANGVELPIGSKNAYPCNENTNNQENKDELNVVKGLFGFAISKSAI